MATPNKTRWMAVILEAGEAGGFGLHPHLLQLVSESDLALLWPGSHQRPVAVLGHNEP